MTLINLLVRAATEAPDQVVVHVDGAGGGERFTSYAELYADALRVAGGLREAGLHPGDPLLIITDDSAEFLPLFWGAILAGVVAVPLPAEPDRLAGVWRLLGQPALAGDARLISPAIRLRSPDGPPAARLLSVAELRAAAPAEPVAAGPEDLAFLQFSSGSTGTPKGVELTHGNLIANLDQSTRASRADASDVVVTWMPYFHDMGLIGTHLAPLYVRCKQVRISPIAFAKRPELWLRTADRHRATILSAASFALALTARRVGDEILDRLDLSSVRLVMVGAEPISPAVWRSFAAKLGRARLDPRSLQPVYGLAEATVAVSFPPMGELARPHRLSRAALARGVAVDAAPEAPAVELMDVGLPVPGCTIRIVDDSATPVEDGLVGHIQVRGPHVTRGYHRDPQATAAALTDDGWLRTGDLGFVRAGRLCVTGRHKDVLFVHGRNFHASDLEEVAAGTPGLGAGPIAVVGTADPVSGRERVVVFVAASAARDPEAGRAVRARVAEALGYDGVEVQVVPNGTFTRTTSGKLRRHVLRERLQPRGEAKPAAATLAEITTAEPTTAGPAEEPAALFLRQTGTGAALATRAESERIVRAIWSRVLGIPADRIGPDDRFMAIGGSSLKAMEVLAALEDTFGRTLNPVLLRDGVTVTALADLLLTSVATPTRNPVPPPAAAGYTSSAEPGTGVAIIGMACRFPDADTPERFWANLLAGQDSVTPVTRWPNGGHGAFLADPALFDAGYFGIGDAEARHLDPHARIFLELAHEALERAGYAGPRRHGRRIGVFAAVGESGYPELISSTQSGPQTRTGNQRLDPYALTGTLRNLTAARVAHLLDLHGPALAVDTACSSALVALHLARLSLAAGDCDVAVVGGVNLNLTATGERLLDAAQALSPTGRCRAFDADADGFVPGEGGAALVLTRLPTAGDDQVLAVVRGTAVNNDGRSLSLMAPNPVVQQEVIRQAYRDCGVDPADVSYVEAHGTGTAVGDPIEARSLAHAFPPLPHGQKRLLGSVKTNIGHLLNAAGWPALVKVVLALQHREIPPSLHHARPSSRFDLAAAGFEVLTERRPWTGPLVAGINSFGFGGTNAHAILTVPSRSSGPSQPSTRPEPTAVVDRSNAPPAAARSEAGPHLLTLSARSAAGLHAAAAALADHLRRHPCLHEGDVCATASNARDDGPHRLALVVDGDLTEQLTAAKPRPPVDRAPRLAFLFDGPGALVPGLGAALHATAPVFRTVLDELSASAGPIAGRSIVDWCTDRNAPSTDLRSPQDTAPLVVAFAVAQTAQLRAYGIRPDAVAGHGAGVLAAAVAAGSLTPAQAVRLAATGDADLGRVALEAADVPLLNLATLEWAGTADRPDPSDGHCGEATRRAAAVDRLRAAGYDTLLGLGAPGGAGEATEMYPAGLDSYELLATAGALWSRGVPLDRTHLDSGTRRVPLPTYPFQRRRYWITDPPPPILAVPRWTEAPALRSASVAAGRWPARGDESNPTGDGPPATTDALTDRITLIDAGAPTQRGAVDRSDAVDPNSTPGQRLDAVVEAAAAALAAAPRTGPLLVVTRDLHSIGAGPERPNPFQAVWSGLAMALADENPGLGVRLIDLSSTESEDAHRFALAQESADPPLPGAAQSVAWRDGRRLVRQFHAAPEADTTDLVRDLAPADGRYLIVGGAGAVGAAIARHLARRGHPTLLLAGRSAEPTALLDELRALGAAVSYRVTDVTDPADVTALVSGHRFDVVIQAAGVVRPGSLRAKSAADLLAGLAAKVRGTALLARALRGTDPLLIALSSVSSAIPGLAGAVGDYVAGNAFLDAFAAAERLAGHRVVAVNLPAIAGGGMATAVHRSTLPLDQVPDALWAAASLGTAQVLVTPPANQPGHPFRTLPAQTAATSADRLPQERHHEDDVVDLVRELLAGPLDREPAEIGLDEPFLTLGLDSLTAVDLVKELETRLGRTLSTTLFFEHRTLGELARHVAGAAEFPLSPVQQAFHTTGRLYPEVPAYAYVRQTVPGPIDSDRLASAFAELERRHPMLRVRFGARGQHFTRPGGKRPEWFSVIDLTEPIEDLDARLRNRTFDLTREAPVRAVLAIAGPDLAYLIVVVHHAAADGYSLAVLGDELWSLHSGTQLPAPPRATFADHEASRTAPTDTDLAFWRSRLDSWPGLALPFDGDAGDDPRAPYAVHLTSLDPAVTARLTARARAAGVSLFHLLLAGYVRCLSRWSGQTAVPVSVARAGRQARLTGIDRMVGPFADTLPVLVEVSPDEPATVLADRLRQAWLVAEQHGSVSTADLARLLATNGAGPRTASPASFSFARFPGAGDAGPNVRATVAGTASAATKVGLVCFEAHATLHFSWNHPAALFEAATVERLAAEHLAEMQDLADTPVPQALPDRSGRPRPDRHPAPIIERIRAQSHRTPAATAVLTNGEPLTYLDLDLASDRLAAHLATTGARRIGLLTAPGADTLVGLLGILKAGAAWVPLDLSHPPARLSDQLSRARADVVVCDTSTCSAARALGGRRLVTTTEAPHALPPPVSTGPDDVAYVIFTSGSTGRPKGVPVTHRAMANYLDWSLTAFGYRPGDRLAQTAPICFDASVRQLLAPLLVGATVVAWDRDIVRDPDELLRRAELDRITVWSSVPTLWEKLLTAAEKRPARRPDLALRWVHVGGEELSPAHVRRWFDLFGPGQRIANLYGPTETTINATFHVIEERPADDVTHLPIGRPIGGALAEVVGEDGRPCAPGEVGELHIGGVGVAAGYLDDHSDAFVERDGTRWYRSGDRAVQDDDGLLWFRGRVDDQVKIRGYRVEPGEVEAVLRAHPAVDNAAVLAGDRLLAWVQPRPGVTLPDLRAHLEELLPAYLVPARLEIVAALPLTASGKVDRAALQLSTPVEAHGEPPATDTERLLARIWSQRLGIPRIGRDDDYFALGGDSIGVLDVFADLGADRPALPSPTVIYQHRTLAALAAAIDAATAGPITPPATGDEPYPLTPTQRGFLLSDLLGSPSTWLATPHLHGPLDLSRFQKAVDTVVSRHPMLRTVFTRETQHELPPTTPLTVHYTADPGPLDDELAAERATPLTPTTHPPIRLRLLRITSDEHVLLLHAHHLIGDGYSVALLTHELLAAYDDRPLPPIRSTFRDYAAMLSSLPSTAVPRRAGPFPTSPATSTGFTLDQATVARLRGVAKRSGVTPFVPVLTAYHQSLARLTTEPDPLIGVAVTGRDHALPDLTRIFGPCATAVAVRPGPDADLRAMAAAVRRARSQVFSAPEGWQFFFTYLDFDALPAVDGATLTLTWPGTDPDLTVPPGTDVLLAVRPTSDGLRLTLRGRISPTRLADLATEVRTTLLHTARLDDSGASTATRPPAAATPADRVDAALIGYLPAPAQLAAIATDLPSAVRAQLPRLDRETIRALVFPDDSPRLLETVTTPLGRSAFVCLPRFADELSQDGLAAVTARAVDLAARHGARTVSLAGMIPARTGHGAAVIPLVRSSAQVTTGHAVTAVSVVRATLAALALRGRRLSDCTLAVVGAGSIGTSALHLLLAHAEHPPAALVLCDLPSAAGRLAALATTLRATARSGPADRRRSTGGPGPIEIVAADPAAPDEVYAADLIVAATSGGPGTIDVDRLRPGTVLVDDSFPHCFDTARAFARMRDHRDVLITGGGLLDCGRTDRTVSTGLPLAAGIGLADTIASCQLESLLHAATPDLPLVHGPVEPHLAAAYWNALAAADVRAAAPHLLNRFLPH